MCLLLLGSLYLYIVINLVKTTDPYLSHDSSRELLNFENCTQCNIKPSSCICWDSAAGNTCLICCTSSSQCCYCDDCAICWHAEWQLMTMTHVSISILFVLGLTGLFIIYCKICHRTRRIVRARCILMQEEHDTTMHCSTVEGTQRERPPPYNEVCGAPPLYTSPYNRASMQEAPPTYPGSPKLQERSRDTNDTFTPSAQSIAQHM